ncbi:ABC transporter substrate-binding protein [Rhodococcus globerulus]|uniref:ABC transporter substrate-binding protein n=1 Tax=Rhodococcus globerulus TaxID=33008 RepID=A0ABU4C2X6_RHOGO|nr:ABC transporter substrate-binding protein [Rhodococcus globerulus]MDV6270852.1 ABC transporter substrate-binding protein [Rhodococcus globerulus]
MIIGVTACSTSTAGNSDEIKLGLLTSVTGGLASLFGQDTVNGAEARIKLANDTDELSGITLSLAVSDDHSDPNQSLGGVQQLVDKEKVFAVLAGGAYFFNGYRYTTQKNVPAVGMGFDGPQWSDDKNSNLFAVFGTVDPNFPDFTGLGDYFKSKGGTKACGLSFAGVPQSGAGLRSEVGSARLAGLETPYVNTEVPAGSTDFTAISLAMKSAGCDVLISGMGAVASNVALLQAVKNAGIELKASYINAGYTQSILDDPASLAVSDGVGFGTGYQPATLQSPATKKVMDALSRYANWNSPNPTTGQMFGWLTADLAINGIKVAGPKPTQQSFIESLRKVTDYTADGLMCPVDLSSWGRYISGLPGDCTWIAEVQDKQFVSLTGEEPVRISTIPGTSNN